MKIYRVVCEICNFNALEFKRTLWGVTIGDALIVFKYKSDKENDKMKFEMMQTEMICKSWGVDIGFSKNLERKKRSEHETKSILGNAGFDFE